MALIIVDTANDVVNAGDGVTSLREALILAQGTAGADRIEFNLTANTLVNANNGVLEIVAGEDVTISGDIDGDGDADIAITAGFQTPCSPYAPALWPRWKPWN